MSTPTEREQVPGLQRYDQAEMPACGADLLDRGVLDAHAGPAVDQEQLPLERGKPRGPFGDHGIEHRPDAELFGAIALQRHFRDAALDDLKVNLPVPDVLRRNDRAAEVKSGFAIDVPDRGGDRGQVGLRHLFPEIGLIRRNQPALRYRGGAGDGNAPQYEQRLGIALPRRPRELRHRQPGPSGRRRCRLLSSKRLSVCSGA